MKPKGAKRFLSPGMYWMSRKGPTWHKSRIKAYGSRTKKAGK